MNKVTGYVCYFDNGCVPPLMTIQLVNGNMQVGTIQTTDPAYFSAVIDMLRNEGPHLYWSASDSRLMVGLEEAGEGEE